jgi:hypothetical protein
MNQAIPPSDLKEVLKELDAVNLQLQTTNLLLEKIAKRLIAQNILSWVYLLGPITIAAAMLLLTLLGLTRLPLLLR